MWGQQLVNALVIGSVYALFGLGFNLVLGALNILNIAHGALFTIGAVTAYAVSVAGYPFAAAAIAAMLVAGVVAIVLNELALGPLRRRGGGGLTPLITTLGAAIVIMSVIQQMTNAQILRLPAGALPQKVWVIAGARVSFAALLTITSAALVLLMTAWLLQGTKFGTAIRATEFNEDTARMVGLPTERIVRGTFFLSGALAGLAGVLTGVLFNSVHFRMGESYLLKGFVVVVLGGFGSVPGTIAASFILAALEVSTVAAGYSSYRDAVAFGFLVLILLVRPAGLFRSPERARP